MRVNAPSTLLDFLMEKVDSSSKTNIKKMIKLGKVMVDGLPSLRPDDMLKRGQEVEISRRSHVTMALKRRAQVQEFKPLYEDKFLVAYAKPGGMLSIGTKQTRGQDLFGIVRVQHNTRTDAERCDLFWVHGLDKDVSGLMIFAKNEETKENLRRQWDKNVRRYTVLTESTPRPESGIINTPIEGRRPQREGEKPYFTKFKVLKAFRYGTLVEATAENEQKYQVRFHMASLQTPIVGDTIRGAKSNPLGRIAIHFGHLELQHPVTKEPLVLTAPIPREFLSLAKFGKESKALK